MTDLEAGMPSYAEELRVAFGDTDAAGVVFYPNYYRWFDRMTHELFRSLGQLLSEHAGSGQAPIVVESHCNFRAPLHYDDVVHLEARVGHVGERHLRIDHRITSADCLVAQGYEIRTWVRLSQDGIRPETLPDELRAALLHS